MEITFGLPGAQYLWCFPSTCKSTGIETLHSWPPFHFSLPMAPYLVGSTRDVAKSLPLREKNVACAILCTNFTAFLVRKKSFLFLIYVLLKRAQVFFFFFKLIFIAVCSCFTMLVSAVPQSESFIRTHISPLCDH